MAEHKTPLEMERELGEQIRSERLRKNMTMKVLAMEAGISEQTLRNLEDGSGSRVETLIRVVRALGKTSWLESFKPRVSISPMQMLNGIQQRQRASKAKD